VLVTDRRLARLAELAIGTGRQLPEPVRTRLRSLLKR
jgi:hypothetical protein